jgi:hypothetical protein
MKQTTTTKHRRYTFKTGPVNGKRFLEILEALGLHKIAHDAILDEGEYKLAVWVSMDSGRQSWEFTYANTHRLRLGEQ